MMCVREKKMGFFTKSALFAAAFVTAAAVGLTGCGNSALTSEQLVTPKNENEQDGSSQGGQYGQSGSSGQNGQNSQNGQDGQNGGAEAGQKQGLSGSAASVGNQEGIAGQVQAPERYEADFSSYGIHVHADAEVALPKASGFKLYNVSGRPFSQEDYDMVSHGLLKDAPLWKRDYDAMEKSHGFIRSEIEERIADLKARAKKYGGLHEMDGEKEKSYDEILAEWTLLLENAPEEAILAEVPAIVPYVETEDREQAFLANQLDALATVEGEDFTISMNNVFQPDFQWVEFAVRSMERGIGGSCYLCEEAADTNLPVEDIKKKAAALMQEMGLADFAPSGGEYFIGFLAEGERNAEAEERAIGYGIHFTRSIDGIPVTYTHDDGVEAGEDPFTVWPYEKIDVIFDRQGITDFFWQNPYTLEKQSDELVFLMPFSDIKDIFEEMILEKNKWLAEEGDVSIYYFIDKVQLGYMRIRNSQGAGEGTMIPVWDFFGSEKFVYADGTEASIGEGKYESKMTIHAMDGTVVDRHLGY